MALASFRKVSQNPTKFTKKLMYSYKLPPPLLPCQNYIFCHSSLPILQSLDSFLIIMILQFQALEVSSQALEFVPILTMSSFQEIVLMLLTKNVGHVDINGEPTLKPSFS